MTSRSGRVAPGPPASSARCRSGTCSRSATAPIGAPLRSADRVDTIAHQAPHPRARRSLGRSGRRCRSGARAGPPVPGEMISVNSIVWLPCRSTTRTWCRPVHGCHWAAHAAPIPAATAAGGSSPAVWCSLVRLNRTGSRGGSDSAKGCRPCQHQGSTPRSCGPGRCSLWLRPVSRLGVVVERGGEADGTVSVPTLPPGPRERTRAVPQCVRDGLVCDFGSGGQGQHVHALGAPRAVGGRLAVTDGQGVAAAELGPVEAPTRRVVRHG